MSLAAWIPSSLRFFSICLLRASAARSSADMAQPILPQVAFTNATTKPLFFPSSTKKPLLYSFRGHYHHQPRLATHVAGVVFSTVTTTLLRRHLLPVTSAATLRHLLPDVFVFFVFVVSLLLTSYCSATLAASYWRSPPPWNEFNPVASTSSVTIFTIYICVYIIYWIISITIY